jgi:16S rRNA (cytosine1402-N4)-methyltransferase
MQFRHTPVMVSEVLAHLDCKPGDYVADCTLGGAGHARAILEKILPGGVLIGIDQDKDAIRHAEGELAAAPAAEEARSSHVRLFHDNFKNLHNILSQSGIATLDGVLADLGLSQYQLEASGRGFSFRQHEPLDMRMNADAGATAGDIVNTASEKRLESIFRDYGEERWARRIARTIVRTRQTRSIQTARELADLVEAAVPRGDAARRKIHPATKVFMALRIAVNAELDIIDDFIVAAVEHLKPGGRICIISFHSLEDRIVKNRFRELAASCVCPPDFPQCVCRRQPGIRILTRKVIRPTAAETDANPMARSARLRAAEKLETSLQPQEGS